MERADTKIKYVGWSKMEISYRIGFSITPTGRGCLWETVSLCYPYQLYGGGTQIIAGLAGAAKKCSK
jgi:hypothetical protein